MANHEDTIDHEERRRLESRMARLEQSIAGIDKRLALAEKDISQIVLTMQSRYEALNGGQVAILAKLEKFTSETTHEWKRELDGLDNRTTALEAIKDRLEGAYVFVRLIGVVGLIGGVISIIRLLKGP